LVCQFILTVVTNTLISLKSLKRLRTSWGILSTAQQHHTFETIAPAIAEIRSRFPTMGARQMVSTLRLDYNQKVSEYVFICLELYLILTHLSRKLVLNFLKTTEPDAVKQRSRRRFKRKQFWAAGVMDIWAFDQHDKWKRFNLWLHLGLDPFSGRIEWLKIWHNNRKPCLITSYYLEAARAAGGKFFFCDKYHSLTRG
jgi:hypothetical protein